MSETVLYEVKDRVATITLNRPDRLNAMNRPLLEATVDALETAASDDAIRVVVFTGAGRGFCAGGDLAVHAAEGVLSGGALAKDVATLRGFMRSSQLLREMP